MALDQIGSYVVRNWLGRPPHLMQQTTELISYPAADYEAVRLLGKRSGLWQLESIVDVATENAGRVMLGNYAGLIGTSVELIRNDYNFTSEGLRVIVHRVELVELVRRIVICNPLTANNTFDLQVNWTLSFTPSS